MSRILFWTTQPSHPHTDTWFFIRGDNWRNILFGLKILLGLGGNSYIWEGIVLFSEPLIMCDLVSMGMLKLEAEINALHPRIHPTSNQSQSSFKYNSQTIVHRYYRTKKKINCASDLRKSYRFWFCEVCKLLDYTITSKLSKILAMFSFSRTIHHIPI